jgi:hypothetical protein
MWLGLSCSPVVEHLLSMYDAMSFISSNTHTHTHTHTQRHTKFHVPMAVNQIKFLELCWMDFGQKLPSVPCHVDFSNMVACFIKAQ